MWKRLAAWVAFDSVCAEKQKRSGYFLDVEHLAPVLAAGCQVADVVGFVENQSLSCRPFGMLLAELINKELNKLSSLTKCD